MTDYHFRHLRRIQMASKFYSLNDISVILGAKYPFTSLVMDETSYKVVPLAQMRHIWDFLGETVTDLVVKGLTDLEIYRILESFPLLKSLEMYGFNFTWLEEDIVPVLPHVEHLKVSNFYLVHKVDSLFGKLPKLKTVDYDIYTPGDVVGEQMVECFEKYPTYMKTLRWYENSKVFDKIREKLLKLETHNINRFFYYTDSDFKYLAKVLEAYPRIREINVTSTVIPSSDFSRITALDLKISTCTEFSLKPLSSLSHLKEFHFKALDVRCPIGHDIIASPKLKILHLNLTKCECAECFHTLAQSFPNLETFHLHQKETTIPRIRLSSILQHWPRLNKSIFNNKRCPTTIEPFEILSFPTQTHQNLKYLSVADDLDQYNNIHEFVPNLISLHFYINSTSQPLDVITANILPRLPELTHVLINFDESSTYQMTEEQNRVGFDNIIKFARKCEVRQCLV